MINVTGNDGNIYAADLVGVKKFRSRKLKMQDGVQRGYGKVKFYVDTGSRKYALLPN